MDRADKFNVCDYCGRQQDALMRYDEVIAVDTVRRKNGRIDTVPRFSPAVDLCRMCYVSRARAYTNATKSM
jgi:hypothetical protein